MKYIAVLITSLIMLASCSDDSTSTSNNNTVVKPWIEINPDSLNGLTNVVHSFMARVNGFDQDELRLDWYFSEGDTLKIDKNTYWNNEATHQFNNPGVYTITVTARDMFADTVIAIGTTIATITN
jgi:hypothetical protein